jgi:hypothetical protein
MTRYTTSVHVRDNSTDPENDALTISHVGLSSPPGLIDWNATNPKTFTVMTTGTLEVYQDGTVIYDDNNIVTNHPLPSSSYTPIPVYFRVSDAALTSANIGVCSFTFTGAAADVTAPTFVSMSPASGSVDVSIATTVTLTMDEAIQQGSGVLTAHNVTTNSTIETFDIISDAGSGAGQVLVSGNAMTARLTSDLPNATQVSWRWPAGIVQDLAGNNLAAKSDDSATFTTIAAAPSTAYPDDTTQNKRGRPGTTDFGTTFTYVVNGAGGDDFTTITAAMAAASFGDTIGVKNGTYREAFTHKSGVTLQAYSTHRPILSAQDPVTGWVQCTSADSAHLGSVLGVNGSPIWKKTGISKSSLSVTDFTGIMPMEDFVPLFNAQDRASQVNIDFQEDESRFWDPVAHGGQYILSGSTVIGVTDTTIINSSRYATNAVLVGKQVRAFGAPNETFTRTITAANVAAGTISFGGFAKDNTAKRRFAIQNVGFAMTQGSFTYVDGGGSTIDVYIYPYNAGTFSTKMTIAARETIGSFADNGTDMVVEGFLLVGGTSSSSTMGRGTGYTDPSNGNFTNRIKIRYNEFRGFFNTSQLHSAGLWLVRSNDVLIEHNTFKYCMAHGIWPNGSGVNQSNVLIRRNAFIRCGSAGSKAYRQNKYMFLHNYHEWCGYRSHGNLGNVYSGGIDNFWWANEWQYCNGYLSVQATVNSAYCFNHMPCDNKYATGSTSDRSNRKIEAQGSTGIAYCFNNHAPAVFVGAASQGNMALDPTDGGTTSYVANNICHGMPTPADWQGTVGYAKNNLITNDQYSGSAGGNLDASDFTGATGKFDTSNVFQPNLALVYTDYANRDWTPASGSAPQKTMGTYSITSVINSYFLPTFTTGMTYPVPVGDFYLDYKFQPINYAALKMGADQSI